MIMGSIYSFLVSCGILKFYEYTLSGVWVQMCYLSTDHNNQWILFLYGTAIDLSWSMNSIG